MQSSHLPLLIQSLAAASCGPLSALTLSQMLRSIWVSQMLRSIWVPARGDSQGWFGLVCADVSTVGGVPPGPCSRSLTSARCSHVLPPCALGFCGIFYPPLDKTPRDREPENTFSYCLPNTSHHIPAPSASPSLTCMRTWPTEHPHFSASRTSSETLCSQFARLTHKSINERLEI